MAFLMHLSGAKAPVVVFHIIPLAQLAKVLMLLINGKQQTARMEIVL